MLVAQGAAALERWFPGVPAPVEVMRAAVDARLR
jgi:shikimate 5-dehydrogenase